MMPLFIELIITSGQEATFPMIKILFDFLNVHKTIKFSRIIFSIRNIIEKMKHNN